MFYSYAEFNDGTRIAYSQIMEDGMVEIDIERDYITLNHKDICDFWKETFHGDISFLK